MSQPKNSAQPVFALADNEALTDKYMGIAMLWTHYISQRTAPIISENQSASEDIHSFRLRVHNKHKRVVEQYLKYVRQEADIIEKKGRELLVSCMPQSCVLLLVMHSLICVPFYQHSTCIPLCHACKGKQGKQECNDQFDLSSSSQHYS